MSGLARLLRGERGQSLVEMLTVMLIMGVVIGGLTTLFVQGSNAELDLNARFQAQLNSRLALDKLRREIHCASVITPTGASSSVTLTLPAQCVTGSGSVTWCTQSVAANRYALYRIAGSSCTGGTQWADYITTASIFNYTAQSVSSLAKLHVDIPVNTNPANTLERYELVDDIVLRNSTRS